MIVAAMKRKKTSGIPRRLGDWKKQEAAALHMLRGDGQHFVKVRDADTGTITRVPVPMSGAHDLLERALVAMLGGTGELSTHTGQCVMTERPRDHIPLSARVSADGAIINPCACSGCEAARKCKCPACRALRRFARSYESDRHGTDETAPASHSTRSELIADRTFDLLRDQLSPRRTKWKEWVKWLELARTAKPVELAGMRGRARVAGRIVSVEAIRRWQAQLGDDAIPGAERLRKIVGRRRGK